jgi:hypothetical protein
MFPHVRQLLAFYHSPHVQQREVVDAAFRTEGGDKVPSHGQSGDSL